MYTRPLTPTTFMPGTRPASNAGPFQIESVTVPSRPIWAPIRPSAGIGRRPLVSCGRLVKTTLQPPFSMPPVGASAEVDVSFGEGSPPVVRRTAFSAATRSSKV